MRDHISIGCTPNDEPCFPVNHPLAKKEAFIYKRQLERLFPKADLKVTANPHDFGTYYEVAAYFDTEDEHSAGVAYEVEASSPDRWDGIAKSERELLLSQDQTLRHPVGPEVFA